MLTNSLMEGTAAINKRVLEIKAAVDSKTIVVSVDREDDVVESLIGHQCVVVVYPAALADFIADYKKGDVSDAEERLGAMEAFNPRRHVVVFDDNFEAAVCTAPATKRKAPAPDVVADALDVLDGVVLKIVYPDDITDIMYNIKRPVRIKCDSMIADMKGAEYTSTDQPGVLLLYPQQREEPVFDASVVVAGKAKKTRTQITAEAVQRLSQRRLPKLAVVASAGFASVRDYCIWLLLFTDYKPILGAAQDEFIKKQGKQLSHCRFMTRDGQTPMFGHLKSGNSAARAMSDDVAVQRRANTLAKLQHTINARDLGRTHHCEATMVRLMKTDFGVLHIPIQDSSQSDGFFRYTDLERLVPNQLKAAEYVPGCQMNFGFTKADMETKYNGMVLVACGIENLHGEGAALRVAFIIRGPEDLPTDGVFGPVAGATARDKYAHLRLLLDTDQQRAHAAESLKREIRRRQADASMSFAPDDELAGFSATLNSRLGSGHKKELLQYEYIKQLLEGTKLSMSFSNDKNEASDWLLQHTEKQQVYGVSMKTAGLVGGYTYRFDKSAAPNSAQCSFVLIVYLDEEAHSTCIGFDIVRAPLIYELHTLPTFCWSKRRLQNRELGDKLQLLRRPMTELVDALEALFE